MNWILAISLEARMAALFVLGAALGGLANLAAYRLAWNRRAISPLSAPDAKAPPRHWFDRVPIFGWLGLWRETPLHGRGFWVRPMAVELAAAFGLAWLYSWEVADAGLLPAGLRGQAPAAWLTAMHAQFAAHTLLAWLMLVATLIDLDEKTIPDAITVSGTLAGLLVMWLWPGVALPDASGLFGQNALPPVCPTMVFSSPGAAPGWPGGFPTVWPLIVGLGCWTLWCFGLLRRDWYTRHGLGRAVKLCLARLGRDPSTVWIGALAIGGAGVIAAAWAIGGRGWSSLVTALVGMAGAAGLVWAVRLIGAAAMRREAMGFGDVTLLGMIGVFIGWQASVLVFFLAPLVAVVVGLVRYTLCRDKEIPYGPFLCLAALFVLVRWDAVWDWARPMFTPDWLVPCALVICMVLLGVLLGLWQAVKRLLFHRP
ncbi:MAG TPA: A24 family peptidase [Thermoguttaceae bacterium]|nr:A24 family peptidase [Thermoguttaceae bacterium]